MTYLGLEITGEHAGRAFEMRSRIGSNHWRCYISIIEEIAYNLAVAGF